MHVDDEFSKFTSSLNKFINKQWSKVRSSTSSLKSAKNLDQVLEEEYETLLREIDFLITEKSCYLSFKNDHFTNTKSSEDLTKILTNHSEEVLKNYINQHEKGVKKDTLDNRTDLINYVTEIIVSRPKCNNKVCTCKPLKSSKEVLTDSILPKENGKGTQTSRGKGTEKPAATQISNNAIVKKVNIEVQTDDWNHDRNCTCGCCPKPKSQVTSKTVSTEEKQLKDATTSDKKITSSKSVHADCVGKKAEANTSTNKLCVPENFETLLSNGASKFSTCSGKRDCACDAYDVKEALKRGLVLPSSEICIQSKKKVTIKEKEKSSKNEKKHETTSEISSSDDSGSKKEKEKPKEKEKNKKKEKDKKESESSSSSTPREKPKKKKEGTTGCFGSKKKNRECDEYCQGIVTRQRSMQTMSMGTRDKIEEAYISSENDKKSIQTSTKSEKGIQSQSSKVEVAKVNNTDKEVSNKENKETGRSKVFLGSKNSKTEQDTQEQDNQEKSKEGLICNKCGRQKRDCTSGCRNTFIIPYASGSNRAIPPGDAESLRMLIKMHSKDTSRQFDNVMAELNHQKGEIRRLNDMYQKMLTSFSDSQKLIGSSKSNSNYNSNKSRESSKPCGCSFSNECSNKYTTSTGKGNNNSNNSSNPCSCSFNSNNTSNGPVRRFGPPNTAVAINMCDTCTVEIGPSNVRNGSCPRDCEYIDGDKQRKEQLNLSKKKTGQNLVSKSDNIGERGDSSSHQTDSVSTIYKNNKQNINLKKRTNITKKNGYEDLRCYEDNIRNEDEEDYSENIILAKDTTDRDTETDTSEPNKKPRNIHSSRVLVWLKRSWITIKNKTEQCRHKDKERREEAKVMKQVLNLCQKRTKRVASDIWKSLKRKLF